MLALRWTYFVILVVTALASHADAAEKVALVVSGHGEIRAVAPDGSSRNVKPGSLLYEGERIETASRARVRVRFRDDTVLALGGESDYTIEHYSYGQGESPASRGHIKNGVFRFMVGKIAEEAPDEFSIDTQTATIGIRGSGGEGITRDGSRGEPASLIIATDPGHQLVIKPIGGIAHVVDDPSVGVQVDSHGAIRQLTITGSLFAAGVAGASLPIQEQEPAPMPMSEETIPWCLPARCRITIRYPLSYRKWRRLPSCDTMEFFRVTVLGEIAMDNHSSDGVRDIAQEKERGSARAMLQRAGKEMAQESSQKVADEEKPLELRQRQIRNVDVREAGSAGETMRDLSEQHLQKTRSKEEIET